MTSLHDLWLDVPTLEADDRLVARVVELTAVSRARAHDGGGFVMTGTGHRPGCWSIRPQPHVTRRGCRDR